MGKGKKRHGKPKKDKIQYVDDGSTVVDMSGLTPKLRTRSAGRSLSGKPEPTGRSARMWQTYKDAVRAMIGPMLIFLGGMAVVFFLVWLILGFV